MDRELAFKWADELDSGSHIQGFGALEYVEDDEPNDLRQCCLGVAARMCNVDESRIETSVEKLFGKHVTEFDGNSGLLSYALYTELGMYSDNGLLPVTDRDRLDVSLSLLNDNGFTFSQIADLIRHFYEEL